MARARKKATGPSMRKPTAARKRPATKKSAAKATTTTVAVMPCVNIKHGKHSYIALVSASGGYTSSSKIKNDQITSNNNGVWEAKAKFQNDPTVLPIKLKCTTKPTMLILSDPPTGDLTIVVEGGGPSPPVTPVTYVDDDP